MRKIIYRFKSMHSASLALQLVVVTGVCVNRQGEDATFHCKPDVYSQYDQAGIFAMACGY